MTGVGRTDTTARYRSTDVLLLVYDDDAQDQRNPGRGRGLVWLVGMDGNDMPSGPEETETQLVLIRAVEARA